jgi:hypothetical protein
MATVFYANNHDNDDASDDEITLHRNSRKRKKAGADLKALFEWEDDDFEPEEIIFDTKKSRYLNRVTWSSQYLTWSSQYH